MVRIRIRIRIRVRVVDDKSLVVLTHHIVSYSSLVCVSVMANTPTMIVTYKKKKRALGQKQACLKYEHKHHFYYSIHKPVSTALPMHLQMHCSAHIQSLYHLIRYISHVSDCIETN